MIYRSREPLSGWQALGEWCLVLGGSAFLTIALLGLIGCHGKAVADVETVRPLAGISSASARADVRADNIIDLVAAAKDIAEKRFAELVITQAAGIKADIAIVNQQVDAAYSAANAAQDAKRKSDARADKAETELAAERKHWAGYQLRRLMAWVIGIAIATWAIVGTLIVVLGKASPFGLGMVWSKRLARLLPFANVFSWMRDRGSKS